MELIHKYIPQRHNDNEEDKNYSNLTDSQVINYTISQ